MWFGKPAPEKPRVHRTPESMDGWHQTVWGTLLLPGEALQLGDRYAASFVWWTVIQEYLEKTPVVPAEEVSRGWLYVRPEKT